MLIDIIGNILKDATRSLFTVPAASKLSGAPICEIPTYERAGVKSPKRDGGKG